MLCFDLKKKKTYERRKRRCSNGFYRISKFIEMKDVVILVNKSR